MPPKILFGEAPFWEEFLFIIAKIIVGIGSRKPVKMKNSKYPSASPPKVPVPLAQAEEDGKKSIIKNGVS